MGSEEVKFSRACEPPNFSPVQTRSPASQASWWEAVGQVPQGFPAPRAVISLVIASSVQWAVMGMPGVGWELCPSCCSYRSGPHAESHRVCHCHPPPIPETTFSLLPCSLFATLTCLKLTKLLSPEFLFIRDQVCVILGISPSIKIDCH